MRTTVDEDYTIIRWHERFRSPYHVGHEFHRRLKESGVWSLVRQAEAFLDETNENQTEEPDSVMCDRYKEFTIEFVASLDSSHSVGFAVVMVLIRVVQGWGSF